MPRQSVLAHRNGHRRGTRKARIDAHNQLRAVVILASTPSGTRPGELRGVTAHHHDEVGVLMSNQWLVIAHRDQMLEQICYRWSVSNTRSVVDREHTLARGYSR